MIKSNNNTPFLGSFFNGGKMKKILVLIILTVSMIIMKPTIFIKASTITVIDYYYQNFYMELKLS